MVLYVGLNFKFLAMELYTSLAGNKRIMYSNAYRPLLHFFCDKVRLKFNFFGTFSETIFDKITFESIHSNDFVCNILAC